MAHDYGPLRVRTIKDIKIPQTCIQQNKNSYISNELVNVAFCIEFDIDDVFLSEKAKSFGQEFAIKVADNRATVFSVIVLKNQIFSF